MEAVSNYSFSRNWPSIGEFDILENVNCKPTTFGTLHCGTNPGGECNETTGLSGSITPKSLPQGNFHAYTFEIDRTTTGQEAMRWFVDDEQYKEIKQSELSEAVWYVQPFIFDLPVTLVIPLSRLRTLPACYFRKILLASLLT